MSTTSLATTLRKLLRSWQASCNEGETRASVMCRMLALGQSATPVTRGALLQFAASFLKLLLCPPHRGHPVISLLSAAWHSLPPGTSSPRKLM